MVSIEQLREPKIFKMAIFDLTGTFIIAFIIHIIMWSYPLEMKEKEKRTIFQYMTSLLLIFITLVGLGVISHRIFKVKSALSGYIGFNDMPR